MILILLALLCLPRDARPQPEPPFRPIDPQGLRIAEGRYRVATSLPGWDSRGALSLPAGTRLRRLRSYEAGGRAYALCVDEEGFRGVVVAAEGLGSSAGTDEGTEESPYDRARRRWASIPMAGDGRPGIALTLDLCPSRRGWDLDLFELLRRLGEPGPPLPVAVCVSGGWIRGHEPDFARLLAWHRRGELEVTLVNHSDTHPAGARRNFLEDPAVDLDREVLGAEAAMLARGAVPSPFFRFPGLAYTPARLRQLERLGLIAVGADHWPARDGATGRRIPEGILLLHANGNERGGVAWFEERMGEPSMRQGLRDGSIRFRGLAELAGQP